MAVLDIRNVSKAFGAVRAVESFDLTVADGELVCLLGPSGSGKSTLLRMIGGFETPTRGTITIDGEDVTRIAAREAPDRHGLPEPRALDPHERLPEPRLRPQAPPPARGRDRRAASRPRSTRSASPGYGERHDASALRRPAAARGARPLASSSSRRSCSSTSPSPASTSTCASACARRSATCSSASGSPPSSSPTARTRRWRSPTASSSCATAAPSRSRRPTSLYREPATPFVAGFIGTMNLDRGRGRRRPFRHAGFTLPVPVARRPGHPRRPPRGARHRPRRRRRGRQHPPRHRLRHPRHRRHRARRRPAPEVDGPRRPRLDGRARRSTSRPRAFAALPRQRRHPPQRLSLPPDLGDPRRPPHLPQVAPRPPPRRRPGLHRPAHPRGHGARRQRRGRPRPPRRRRLRRPARPRARPGDDRPRPRRATPPRPRSAPSASATTTAARSPTGSCCSRTSPR